MTKVSITAQIDVRDLAHDLGRDESENLIFAIDQVQCDAEFTESIIVKLIQSMKKEFDGFPQEAEAFKKVILGAIE